MTGPNRLLTTLGRKKTEQAFLTGVANAAFRYQACDESGRRDIEGVVADWRVGSRGFYNRGLTVTNTVDIRDFRRIAFLDWNFRYTVSNGPVDRCGRQCDIEGNAVVVCGEGFEVGPYLVRNVAAARCSVGACNHNIDHAVLHQMAARIVDDQRVRNIIGRQLPGGELRALIARPGFIDPDVNVHATLMSEVDRCRRSTPN